MSHAGGCLDPPGDSSLQSSNLSPHTVLRVCISGACFVVRRSVTFPNRSKMSAAEKRLAFTLSQMLPWFKTRRAYASVPVDNVPAGNHAVNLTMEPEETESTEEVDNTEKSARVWAGSGDYTNREVKDEVEVGAQMKALPTPANGW
jgi:hypothetical protein